MEETGFIEVLIEGQIGNKPITPLDVDISEIKEMLTDVETFLYPGKSEKYDRPHIAYSLENGSAKHKFILPVTTALIFNALTSEISARNSIEFLEPRRADIIEKFQRKAIEKSWEITLTSSSSKGNNLKINKSTNFYKAKFDWVETEVYLYGEVYDAGGKNPNIHIDTKEYGTLKIEVSKEKLRDDEKNRLFKVYGVRAVGKQNLNDGSFKDLHFIDYIDYNPQFNKKELDVLIAKETPKWSAIKDIDLWLKEIRGGYE